MFFFIVLFAQSVWDQVPLGNKRWIYCSQFQRYSIFTHFETEEVYVFVTYTWLIWYDCNKFRHE